MRRIYSSDAVTRDDEDQFTPGERDDLQKPQAMRTVPGNFLSRLLVPNAVRYRAISVGVETPRERYPEGATIPFTVTMKNTMPFPVEIPTLSPILWNWDVDGVPEGSKVPLHDPPDETRAFRFDRGERKQFSQRWDQVFRISDAEWEPVGPGEYTIGAGLNVESPESKDLYDQTTIHIDPD